MWRHDARRSAVTSEELPDTLHHNWTLVLPKLEPAWPDQNRLRFDVAYEPVVVGDTLFIASPRTDSVTAYSMSSTGEKWRFYANGPVRFAPLAWKDKLYVVSDDGCLYCLSQSNGELLWKSRGAPDDRLVLGNGRLISMWPARGAPVIADGTVYFAAGIWPVMGVFVYALDAETGGVIWQNDTLGPMWIKQPHDSPAFAGIAPQGYLVVVGDILLVPNGRAVPAALDRRTGRLKYFHLARNQYVGNYALSATEQFFVCGGQIFDVKTGLEGHLLGSWPFHAFRERSIPMLDGDTLYAGVRTSIDKRNSMTRIRAYRVALKEMEDRRRRRWIGPGVTELWHVDAGTRVHLRAGGKLYASDDDNTICAIQLPDERGEARITWCGKMRSPVESMVAANGRLFASTRDGAISCYSGSQSTVMPGEGYSAPVREAATARAREILESVDVREGYCLALGLTDGRLLQELAAQSDLHVIGIDADAAKVDRIRRSIPEDVYGERVAIICADPATVKLPPCLASLVVSEDVKAGGCTGSREQHIGFVRRVHDVLRPYGGVACFDERGVAVGPFERLAPGAEPDDVRVDADVERQLVLMRRAGPLKGAADWTHQYADAANSVVSKDELVKLPLGVLWFGGSTHWDILPRHGHGPVEQVVGGRLFIEGPDTLRAADVYTGRVLWRRELPGIGKAYDNTDHQPGANAIGSNFASAPDALYVIRGDNCLRLEPATGQTLSVLTVPTEESDTSEIFGFVSVSGDVLVTGVTPLVLEWDPLFRAEEFWRIIRDGKLDDMVAILEEWTGAPLVPRRQDQKTIDCVLENFNAVLNERSLESRVPEGVLTTRGETDKALEVRAHLAAYRLIQREPLEYDTELRRLNRELLQLLYPNIPRAERGQPGWFNWDHTSSREIVALDRHTGKLLWRRRARLGFRHNAIVSGGGKVYAIDALPGPVLDTLKRRGKTPKEQPRLLALDLATGGVSWTDEQNAFGTWLGYSAEHDVLVQSGRTSRDMLWGEPDNTMSVHRAADGSLLWKRDRWHHGPVMLHGRKILTPSDGYDLLTGDEVTWSNPLTEMREEWRYQRMYGCSSPVASRHLLTFRSAAAGFYDLAGLGGTGNLGGFKSGCSSNLIAADGVLNAPDYTRTCTCSYQNQTSLAFVHMPEVELWTFNPIRVGPQRIERIGINLGAPGDRRDADGTLWIEHPVVGGPSPAVRVRTRPDDVEWYYRHSLRLSGDGKKWVAASGAKGIRRLTVTLCRPVHIGGVPVVLSFPRSYTVRLHFAEPDGLKPGDRVFDIWLQGERVREAMDVSAEADDRPVAWECRNVSVDSELEIRLEPAAGSRVKKPILSGVEIIAEDW